MKVKIIALLIAFGVLLVSCSPRSEGEKTGNFTYTIRVDGYYLYCNGYEQDENSLVLYDCGGIFSDYRETVVVINPMNAIILEE